MKTLFVTRNQAEAAKDAVREAVARVTDPLWVRSARGCLGFVVKVDLMRRPSRGLPKRVEGVRIVYKRLTGRTLIGLERYDSNSDV